MNRKRQLETGNTEAETSGKLRRSKRHKPEPSKGDPAEETAETSGGLRRSNRHKPGSSKKVRDFIELNSKNAEKEKKAIDKGKQKATNDKDLSATIASTRKRRRKNQDNGESSKKPRFLPEENKPTSDASTSQGPAESQEAEKVFNAEELKKMQKEFEYTTNSNFDDIKPSLLAFSHELSNIMHALLTPLTGEKQQPIPQSFFSAIQFHPAVWHNHLQTRMQSIASAHSMDSQKLQRYITEIKSIQRQIIPLVDYLLYRYESDHKDLGELGKVCRQFVERIKGLESTRDKNYRLRQYQIILLRNEPELEMLKQDVKKVGDNIDTTHKMSLMTAAIQKVSSNIHITSILLHRENPILFQAAIKSIDINKEKETMKSYYQRLKDNHDSPNKESVVSLWKILPSVIEVLGDENKCLTELAKRATSIEKQDRVSPAGDQKPDDEAKAEEYKFSETKKNIDAIEAKLEELESRLNEDSHIEAKLTHAQMRKLVHKKESAREVENLKELHAVTTYVLEVLQAGDIQAIQDLYTPFADKREPEKGKGPRKPQEHENNALEVAREISRQSLRKQRKQEIQEKELEQVKEVVTEINRKNPQKFLEEGKTPDKLQLDEAATYLAKIATADRGKAMFVFDVDQTLIVSGTDDWRMPEEWIKGIEKLLDQGHVVTIITGRMIETIDEALDKAGPKGSALKDKLEICGERGSMRRGPKSNKKKILTNKRSEKYVPRVEKLIEDLKSAIDENQTLNEYKKKDLVPQEVPITAHTLGATILAKTFDAVQTKVEEQAQNGAEQAQKVAEQARQDAEQAQKVAEQAQNGAEEQARQDAEQAQKVAEQAQKVAEQAQKVAEQARQDASKNALEIFVDICETIENIVKGVLEKYPEFKWDRRLGLEIQLNPEVTGIHLDKGGAMGQVYKDYGDVSSILVFADGQIDIPMGQRAQELATLRKLLEFYLSQQQRDKRIDFFKGVLSQLQKRYDTNLTQKEMQEMANAFKISFMEEENEMSLQDEDLQKIVRS